MSDDPKRIDPITIWSLDDPAAVRCRHADIESRLNVLGSEEVNFLRANGKLPPHWDPIIAAWLRGERLKPEAGK